MLCIDRSQPLARGIVTTCSLEQGLAALRPVSACSHSRHPNGRQSHRRLANAFVILQSTAMQSIAQALLTACKDRAGEQ